MNSPVIAGAGCDAEILHSCGAREYCEVLYCWSNYEMQISYLDDEVLKTYILKNTSNTFTYFASKLLRQSCKTTHNLTNIDFSFHNLTKNSAVRRLRIITVAVFYL